MDNDKIFKQLVDLAEERRKVGDLALCAILYTLAAAQEDGTIGQLVPIMHKFAAQRKSEIISQSN